jgi:hypothetical protein
MKEAPHQGGYQHDWGGVGRVRSGNGGMAISEKAAAMTAYQLAP